MPGLDLGGDRLILQWELHLLPAFRLWCQLAKPIPITGGIPQSDSCLGQDPSGVFAGLGGAISASAVF